MLRLRANLRPALPVLVPFLPTEPGGAPCGPYGGRAEPDQDWTAQQFRNATTEGLAPRFLIRDRDEKFGSSFDRVAEGAGTRVIKTAVRAPNMNPVGERFVGCLRREALDHALRLDDQHLENVARQYVRISTRPALIKVLGSGSRMGP